MMHKIAVGVWLLHILLCEASGNYPDLLSVPSISADSRFFLKRPQRESLRYKPPTRKHPSPIVTKLPRRPPPVPYRHPKPAPPAAPYRHPKPAPPAAPYRHPKPSPPAVPYRHPKPVRPHQRPAASGHKQHHAAIYEEPNPYSFGYKVKDHYEGTEHGHQEESNGKIVIGTYNVDLPDGRRQTVDYQADNHNGYLANVQYEGEAQYPEPEYYSPAVTFKPHDHNPEHHIPEYNSQDVAQDIYQPSYYLPSVHHESDGRFYKRSTPPPPPPLELQRYEYKQPQPDPSPDTYNQDAASYGAYEQYPPTAQQQTPIQNQYGNEPAYEPAPQPYFQPPPPLSQARHDAYAPDPYAVADPERQQYQQQQQQYLQQQGQYSQYQPEYTYPLPEPEPEPAYQQEPYDYGW